MAGEWENGYVWTFSTPAERFFLRRGRSEEVVDEVMGEAFEGILVSDFHAACHHYPGLKQRCWVHLLRDIQALKERRPFGSGNGKQNDHVVQLRDLATPGPQSPIGMPQAVDSPQV